MSLLQLANPKDGFIKDFIEVLNKKTDASLAFKLFCGIVLVGVALGRRIWFPYGGKNLYPNLYVCLLGESGISRKSTCINIVKKVISHFEENLIVSDQYSPERLFKDLSERSQAIFLYSEFAAVLKYFERSYMVGMKECLTELYDCPPKYRRRLQKEEIVIKDPVISILAGSTPEWLFANMTEEDILGGFFGRFIYVMERERKEFIALPPGIKDGEIHDLAGQLNEIRQVEGEVKIDKVEWVFERFSQENYEEILKSGSSGIKKAFLVRLPEFLLKIAMIYHFSNSRVLNISPEAMNNALALVGYVKEALKKSLEEDLALTPEMRNRIKILKLIQKEPGIEHGKLLRNSNLTSKQVHAIINHLLEEGSIHIEGKGRKNDPKRYFAVNFL